MEEADVREAREWVRELARYTVSQPPASEFGRTVPMEHVAAVDARLAYLLRANYAAYDAVREYLLEKVESGE